MSETDVPQQARPGSRRAILLGLLLLVIVVGVFLAGKAGLLPDSDTVTNWMRELNHGPWGLVAVVAVFCVAAFVGLPQFALIAAAVAVFGPWQGAAYSWIANMVSGAITFWIGRAAGEQAFRRYAGKSAQRLSRFVGRNALIASAVVRNVPTGPFLLVNMAFGVSNAKFRDFWIGMGIGTIPKIALVAFAGRSLMAALQGNIGIAILAAIAAAAVYAGGYFYFRRKGARSRQILPPETATKVDSAAEAGE
ncbi:VTT domain-containing protein [Hyphomonas sp. WL0036]|uniref:TVP38/TMEM64 family protein n=1 Tax=Hyphomonas sediminis TaxID=2866160 RepID=UPI001C815FBC|nr:VTT domain-containing protein [Hyphomonas sediminis]MBY9065584.1 VTT domain-containing protein [Hyphomonas sediminis]